MCTAETNFQEGVTITVAEMIESSKGQGEHLKHRPMTLARYSSSHLVLFLQLPCKGPFVITWDGKEVIHWGDVIHSLCQHSNLLFPLVFEDVHVVLGNFALRPGSQCESGVDDLFVRNNPWTYGLHSSKEEKQVKDHVETLDLAALADKGILSVWEDNQNMKDGVGYQILVFCLLFFF